MLEYTVRSNQSPRVDSIVAELEEHGIVIIPDLLTQEQLASMRLAFDVKLRRLRWNNFDGYERTEIYRHMVHDVLALDQGFVTVALDPLVNQVLRRYLGPGYELTEAKGWKSLPTSRDFHGWHGDAWYEQTGITEIHREVKLAVYLTDVKSGAFNYIKGSHRKQHPKMVPNSEVESVSRSQIAELLGAAGSAFLFDTSGIHRQGVPMLEPREAIFYNYHDPEVKLQHEDLTYYRYHPLILNAAFLGHLSAEDQRILGFGRKTNYVPAFERAERHRVLQKTFASAFGAKLRILDLQERVRARLRRVLGR